MNRAWSRRRPAPSDGGRAPGTGGSYRDVSLWFDTLPGEVVARAPLAGDVEVDVAVVGGGFTGLWTAYHLARADPHLRVAVVEAEVVGFGASGRNGGWCSALFAAGWAKVARAGATGATGGAAGARAMQRAMVGAVDGVARFCADEGVDADLVRGGSLALARSPAQLERVREEADEDRSWGVAVDWLDPAQVSGRVRASSVLGAAYRPNCAALHPGKLVRGLAAAAGRRGVSVYERTPARALAPGRVETPAGTVRAEVVVRATEGFTPALPGLSRTVVPVYSLMVATEPLPEAVWDELGWQGRETVGDGRHLLVYAQRTADGRIAFGGRGAPYHLGSAVRPAFDRDPAVFAALRSAVAEMFPAAAGARFTHAWGGPLGVARDWFPSVGYDRRSGMAWAGGYVGDGVATSHLAGATLADLILGRDTDLTRLPWVGHRSPAWEPEPLRFLGVNAGRWLAASADRVEARTGRPARRSALLSRLTGG